MRYLTGLTFLLLILLASCAPTAEAPAAPPALTPSLTARVLPTITSLVETPPPAEGPHVAPALDAQTSFEVAAAVHAYVLMLTEWASQGITLFERQAMIRPLLELGMGPLGEILAGYAPHPGLASTWVLAADVYSDLYPQALDWVGGQISDQDFRDFTLESADSSRRMIEAAVLDAQQLGVDTARYGPGYAGAVEVVYVLQPATEPASEAAPSLEPLAAAPGLQAVEVHPFLYPFAGSEVFLVIGRVENTGPQPQQGVEIEIRFYNFLDEHLGTSRGRLLAAVANPGGIYPFSASTVTEGEEAALKDWTRYEVSIFGRPAQTGSYQSFELVTTAVAPDSSGGYLVEGELTNHGERAVNAADIRVGVMAFNAAGELVGVGEGAVSSAGPSISDGVLPPGSSAGFSAQIEAVSGDPADFRFFAEVLLEN